MTISPTTRARVARRRRTLARVSLGALVALSAGVSSAQAATLNIHSGNPHTNPGKSGFDGLLQITSDTAHPSLAVPREPNLVLPFGGWAPALPGTSWVSNDPSGLNTKYGTFTSATNTRYAIDFTVPTGAIGAQLTGSYYADNNASVYLDGLQFRDSSTFACHVSTFNGPATQFATALPLTPGKHTLTFSVGNCSGPTGLDFDANVTYTPGPPGPANLSHFKCYKVKPTNPASRAVVLTDQFGTTKTKVHDVRELCNPVTKLHGHTKSPMLNPSAHLVCRRTVDSGTVPARKVRLSNQFGIAETVTTGAQTLCLPSLKRKLYGKKTITPTGKNPEKVLDHFRCYGVQPRNVSIGVTLKDQFGSGAAKVLRLVKLCNPVRKTYKHKITGFKYPRAHLACYEIKDGMQFKPLDVAVLNQFGRRRLRVQKAQTLCVPSFKELIKKFVELPHEPVFAAEPFTVGLTTTSCNDGESVVHTVNGTTNPAHPYGNATGVLNSGLVASPAQTVAVGADGSFTAQVKTPRTPGTYRWDWVVSDIDDAKASASIELVVKAENPRC